MSPPRRGRNYEKIKADLLAEAQAVGLYAKGAALDPTLELLVNGFARELESIYDRVDLALEHNRRTLLRNYFEEPFLESPAQTVVGLQVKQPAPVGPGMRIAWQRPSGGLTPEYVVLGERPMVPLQLAAALYWVGDALYRLQWNEALEMTTSRHRAREVAPRPRLLLGLTTSEAQIDSEHLSLFLQPNDTGLPGLFPGADPQRGYAAYLDAATWTAATPTGEFTEAGLLIPAGAEHESAAADGTSRFPTEASFFARMAEEHLYARVLRRFAAGTPLAPGALPALVAASAGDDEALADLAGLAGSAIWLLVQLPYPATDDPREILSLIAANARLAIGYHRDPRDRFNFTRNDYNVAGELFEFGLGDRPGQYCKTFGRWVVASLEDQTGHPYPYVYDALSRGEERWFTLEAGVDDITLMVHVPRRRVPDVGYFDLNTGHILGAAANTSQLDCLAPRPANALDYPEIQQLRMLAPARGGGDGYLQSDGATDSLEGGRARILDRQFAHAAVWLRTRDRLITLPDLRSYLTAMDSRIERVAARRASLPREGRLVPGVELRVGFSAEARLAPAEQTAICRMATRQIEKRVPIGMWVEVVPRPDEEAL
ncbi:MAG: hypothetical protein KAY32_10415 [Candidatus Eisenbacteria sp.]|nr:hypothetical protein [Candidatus Eisenbacteria bacterium]